MTRRAGMSQGKVHGFRGEFDSELKGHKSVTSDTDTEETDQIVGVDTSGGSAVTVTLSSTDVDEGRIIVVKDEGGDASSYNITVDTEGSETIDGSSSTTISSNYGKIHIYSDGSDWFTL